jgi:hypothetical protein
MNDQLGSASRALLDAAREGITPDPHAIARVRGKVEAAAAVGAAAGATAFATKLGVLAVVAAVVTGGVLYANDAPVPVEAPALERSSPRPIVREQRAPIAMPPMDVSSPRVVEPAKPARPPSGRKPAAPRPAGIELGREVELIDTAMAAMRRGDATAALAAVRTHATETAGSGQLAEDAAAIEIEAACRLHDATVGAKLAAFDARWPSSAQRSRLTTTCQ